MELLKETVPKLLRVVVPSNPNEPSYAQLRKETELAATALKIQLHFMDARSAKDVETAFREAVKRRAEAVLVPTMPIVAAQRAQIADLAVKNRLPAMYGQPEYVELGGLMFYGASINDLFRRAATYVEKILKGAKPADLPVEQPTKFEFVINLKAAKQIGLTIPVRVLERAESSDQMIQFWIFDYGEGQVHVTSWTRFSENPKSKMVGFFGNRFRAHGCWAGGTGAADRDTVPASVSWIQALLLVVRSSWMRSGRS